MTRVEDLLARRAPAAASVTIAELEAWQSERIGAEPGPMVGPATSRRPARWMTAPRWRCVNGHVGVARPCIDGLRCRKCGGLAVLTSPEDIERSNS